MNPWLTLAHLALMLCMPVLLIGVINRTKSWWVGRQGPGLFQSGWDMWRLLNKHPVVSTTASLAFRAGAYVVLVSSVVAGTMVPLIGSFAPIQFSYDFVVVAYTLGLARLVMMISAMDVGSSFEGMGAAREAAFASYAEPALFLLLGSACVATGMSSFADVIGNLHHSPLYSFIVGPLVFALVILLQTEASRLPVDDPQTHLELTMIHEVMILDHSGPELAAMQFSAALKMSLYAGMIAALVNPFDPMSTPLLAALVALGVMVSVAVVVGCVESLTARLPMRWVTGYVLLSSAAALVSMVVIGFGSGNP